MNARELKIISGLAVFLTVGLPAAAGAIAFRAQPILTTLITGEPGKLPGLTGYYFNHFTGALLTLFVLAALATFISLQSYLKKDGEPIVQMATLLTAACFSALISVVFLAMLILATIMPLYAKIMAR